MSQVKGTAEGPKWCRNVLHRCQSSSCWLLLRRLDFQVIYQVSGINYLGMGRDLWPLASPFMGGGDGEIDELAEMDRRMWRAHKRSALIITSQRNPLFSQEVSSFESFPAATFPSEEKKKVSVSVSAPSFCLSHDPVWELRQKANSRARILFLI